MRTDRRGSHLSSRGGGVYPQIPYPPGYHGAIPPPQDHNALPLWTESHTPVKTLHIRNFVGGR